MTGKVVLKYEMYAEEFTIEGGRLVGETDEGRKEGQAYVDEEYALSFVMPNCRVHLTTLEPKQVARMEDEEEKFKAYVKEEPDGIYHGGYSPYFLSPCIVCTPSS